MKKKVFPTLLICVLSLSSCSESDPAAKDRIKIDELEAKMAEITEQGFDRQLAAEAIGAYIGFAEKYPDDVMAVEYYFKAAKICMSLELGSQAIMYFNHVETKYPQSERAALSIFMQAFVYETVVRNLNKAEEYYRKFIDKYPDHEFANDARISIEQLGMSPEELIRQFENMESNPKGDTLASPDTTAVPA
ncbi:MAG: tetratricopeptide repeat protein [Bacteroidetes bacterium]|nr:tetratricopeptide repeat protein [Bacteroidota bacterium]